MEILSQFRVGGLYVPPLPYHHDNEYRNVVGCSTVDEAGPEETPGPGLR